MSFDSVALTGSRGGEDYGSDPVQISSNIGQLEKLSKLIGTTKDSQEIRIQITQLIDSTKNLAKTAAEDMRDINVEVGGWDERSKTRIVQQKLMKELQNFLQRFQELSKFVAKQERAFPVPPPKAQQQSMSPGGFPRTDFSINSGGSVFVEQDQKRVEAETRQFQMKSEVDFSNAIIQDREHGIKEIEKALTEVNEIFIDLSNLVVEQGAMIDNIESNVEAADDYTSKGYEEVKKASEYQKSSRNKMCCLLLIIVIVLAAVVGFVFLFLRPSP